MLTRTTLTIFLLLFISTIFIIIPENVYTTSNNLGPFAEDIEVPVEENNVTGENQVEETNGDNQEEEQEQEGEEQEGEEVQDEEQHLTPSLPNTTPIAQDGSVTTTQNQHIDITLDATDTDGDNLSFTIVGEPSNGKLDNINPSTNTVTYTPNENYFGVDSFTFIVNDGIADSNQATVSIKVEEEGGGEQEGKDYADNPNINDPPIANAGKNINVQSGNNILLDGSKSRDPESSLLTYQWTVDGTPLSNETEPEFIAPTVNADTEYLIELIVNDGELDSKPTQVKLVVEPAEEESNFYNVSKSNMTIMFVTNNGTIIQLDGLIMNYSQIDEAQDMLIDNYLASKNMSKPT